MLDELNNYDWAEVFGEGTGGNCVPIIPQLAPGYDGPNTTFSREDVKRLYGQSDGEGDERDWVCWGILKDGRWFVARASCSYTGWDCLAGNSGDVAGSRKEIIRLGLTTEERLRFGL